MLCRSTLHTCMNTRCFLTQGKKPVLMMSTLNNDEVTIEKNCFMKHENLLKIAVIAGIVDTQPQILWNETVKVSEDYIAMKFKKCRKLHWLKTVVFS